MSGTKWHYFSVDPSLTERFLLQISSQAEFDFYVKKGTQMIPDPANFDAVFKGEKDVSVTEYSFNTKQGFIFAVYTKLPVGDTPVTFQIKSTFMHEIQGLRVAPNA